MTRRILGALAVVMAVAALSPVPLGGQTASKRPEVAKAVPRTPDGRPDFQGYWTNATFIPLERPAEFAGKAEMTEAEAIAYQKKRELQKTASRKRTSTTTTCSGKPRATRRACWIGARR